MRDLLVYVADGNMAGAVGGLLEREGAHLSIGCAQFAFDSRVDIKVAKGQNDPGVYTRADALMRPFAGEYRYAVVIVDEEWDGSPGAAAIEERLREHLNAAGWPAERGLALVVSPEADVWLWSDSPHTATALGWPSWDALRPALEGEGFLAPEATKPERPKEAAEWALGKGPKRIPRSSKLYREVSGKVSIKRCEDNALAAFVHQLRIWFPRVVGG
jgi:hypothetical protein